MVVGVDKDSRWDLTLSGHKVWGIPSSGDGDASFPCVSSENDDHGTRPCIQ